MNNFVSPLMALLSLVAGNSAQNFGSCDYVQEMVPGQRYYVFNPRYPEDYRRGSVCRWIAKSNNPINVTCDPFNLPASDRCSQDAVTITDGSDSRGHRYCGNGNFSFVSKSNQVTITLTSPPTSPGGKFLCTLQTVSKNDGMTNCRCGWKNPTRIVGGVETGVNEFPMMAGLVDAPTKIVFCGATIINEKQVLTAAHCVANINILTTGVLVGDHDVGTGSETNATRLFRVASTEVHPKYNPTTQDYDIALITINGKISFNAQVGPVCLPFQHSPDTFAGNYVDVLGWGSTEFGGGQTQKLQKVQLSIMTNAKCRSTYRGLTTRQMCTYGDDKDSCQMDSGGPLLWQNPTTQRVIEVGLISLGSGCASGEPASNTRIGPFIDWIVQNTPPGIKYCEVE